MCGECNCGACTYGIIYFRNIMRVFFIDNAVICLFEQLFLDRFDSFEFTVYIITLLSQKARHVFF